MTQAEYDRLLVESFYLRPDCPMWRLTAETGTDFLRIPDDFSRRMTVAAFICGHLPKLADLLWRHNSSHIDQIARALTKSKLDTLRVGVHRAALNRERSQTRRDVARHQRIMQLAGTVSRANRAINRLPQRKAK